MNVTNNAYSSLRQFFNLFIVKIGSSGSHGHVVHLCVSF